MKIVVLDFETSGLDPHNGAEPHQLAAIMLDHMPDRQLVEIGRFAERNMRLNQPEMASHKALSISGKTLEQVQLGEDPQVVFNDFLRWILGYTSGTSKVMPAGHNVAKFDIPFLQVAFKNYLKPFEYEQVFDHHAVDTFHVAHFMKIIARGEIKYANLVALTKHYGIPHEPHGAMSDVEATVAVMQKLWYELQP